jgi:DNA-binding CsgD family transcriptional regulator
MAKRATAPTRAAPAPRAPDDRPNGPARHAAQGRGARPGTPEPTSARDRIAGLQHLLGTISDGEIARRAKVARKTVVEFRKLHGIAPYSPPGGGGSPIHSRRLPRASPTHPAPGTPHAARASAEPPASAAPAPKAAVTRRRGRTSALEHFRDVLGTLPDRDIAARVGVSPEAVRVYRTRHGIPARWRTPDTAAARPSHSEEAIAGVRDLVGTLPDAEVARRAGVSRSAVTAFRRRHEIPASSPRGRRKITPAPVARATPTPAAPRRSAPITAAPTAAPGEALRRGAGPPPPQPMETAWQVQGQRGTQISTFSVLASDPVDAARRAQASLAAAGYELVACARIGPVLAAVAG